MKRFISSVLWLGICLTALAQAPTHRPVLHGQKWVALTGRAPGATAGAKIFERGGNAIDAACAMLGVVCTMHDNVGWGGETQALIYDPNQKKVIAINALGVAPTGATPEFFKKKGLNYPPGEGPLAAVVPGNPGGLMTMLAEYGTMSLQQVLAPAMEMAEGYPMDEELALKLPQYEKRMRAWPYTEKLFYTHKGRANEAPVTGEMFHQPDLLSTLRKLVETEATALKAGKSRKEAIYAANDRFYRGDIAEEFARGCQEQGGLITASDLARWKVKIEEPVMTTYKGIDVYKLTCWTQGPTMLQSLNMLENLDLKAMGYNSARYIHTLYQVMCMAFADRDFYYGDPDFPPAEPIKGLLSKDYARERVKLIDEKKNNPDIRPGDPYPFQGGKNPFENLLTNWSNLKVPTSTNTTRAELDAAFKAGTTSIQACDASGWAISVTPSGGWMPVCVAGKTGVGMSQRMQAFVLNESENPFNVIEPGKRPRVTLTPSLAMKNGKPFMCFSIEGGDKQDQLLLQFFLNMVEFGMNVQKACEAPSLVDYQIRSSFGQHNVSPGRVTLNEDTPPSVRKELKKMGYDMEFLKKTSGPITAIYFDQEHGTFWGGVSDYGEDYGIAW